MGTKISMTLAEPMLDDQRGNRFQRNRLNRKKITRTSSLVVRHCAKVRENMSIVRSEISEIKIEEYRYPFENVVFEGGGNKGIAYCGAVRALEHIGIWHQIKRFAGTSAGAMIAALLAVGYNSIEIEVLLQEDSKQLFLDSRWCCMHILPLFRQYGWNTGHKFTQWMDDKLKEKTGKANLTFGELYEMTEKELCIVVTNLNQMTEEYCHPKTTPDLLISKAVRMSMSIPVLFTCPEVDNFGHTDLYVDGGLVVNFPIHVFDGWYLSMKSEDSFLVRLNPLSELPRLMCKRERFGTHNDATLGFLLYSHDEPEVMRSQMEKRLDVLPPQRPNTKQARIQLAKMEASKDAEEEQTLLLDAVERFMVVLRNHGVTDEITHDQLHDVLHDESGIFRPEHEVILFDGELDADEIWKLLDKEDAGVVGFKQLVHHVSHKGLPILDNFFGNAKRREISSVGSFLTAIQDALILNMKRIYAEEFDIHRTVGINTDYIETNDFTLEPDDKAFLIQQGIRSTTSFLRHYVHDKRPPSTDDSDSHMMPSTHKLGHSTLVNKSRKGLETGSLRGGLAGTLMKRGSYVDLANAKKQPLVSQGKSQTGMPSGPATKHQSVSSETRVPRGKSGSGTLGNKPSGRRETKTTIAKTEHSPHTGNETSIRRISGMAANKKDSLTEKSENTFRPKRELVSTKREPITIVVTEPDRPPSPVSGNKLNTRRDSFKKPQTALPVHRTKSPTALPVQRTKSPTALPVQKTKSPMTLPVQKTKSCYRKRETLRQLNQKAALSKSAHLASTHENRS